MGNNDGEQKEKPASEMDDQELIDRLFPPEIRQIVPTEPDTDEEE